MVLSLQHQRHLDTSERWRLRWCSTLQSQNLYFMKLLRWFVCTGKSEKQHSRLFLSFSFPLFRLRLHTWVSYKPCILQTNKENLPTNNTRDLTVRTYEHLAYNGFAIGKRFTVSFCWQKSIVALCF